MAFFAAVRTLVPGMQPKIGMANSGRRVPASMKASKPQPSPFNPNRGEMFGKNRSTMSGSNGVRTLPTQNSIHHPINPITQSATDLATYEAELSFFQAKQVLKSMSQDNYWSSDPVGDIEYATAVLAGPKGQELVCECIAVALHCVDVNFRRHGTILPPLRAAQLLSLVQLPASLSRDQRAFITEVTNKVASAIDVAIQEDRKSVTHLDFFSLYLAMAGAHPVIAKILARRRGLASMERFSEVVKTCGPTSMTSQQAALLLSVLATLNSRGHLQPSNKDVFNLCIKIEEGSRELTWAELNIAADSSRYLASTKYPRVGRMLKAVIEEAVRRGDGVAALPA